MAVIRVVSEVLYWIAVVWLVISIVGLPMVVYKLLFRPESLYAPTQERLAALGTPLAMLESVFTAAVLGGVIYLLREGGMSRLHVFWLVPAYLLICKATNWSARALAERRMRVSPLRRSASTSHER